MNADPRAIIEELGLQPLPGEGGYFAPSWESAARTPGGRPLASAIYFLITADNFSAMHRLRTEELWHFHAGDPVDHVQWDPVLGALDLAVLGRDLFARQRPQVAVPAGRWQGARLSVLGTEDPCGWALLGCTVTPAWAEADFELGEPGALLAAFPQHSGYILALTRPASNAL